MNNTNLPYMDQQDMDMVLTNQEELIRNLKIRDKLGCRNHEMVEIRTFRREHKANSKTTLDFLGEKFVQRSAWKNSMGERRKPGNLVDV